MNYRTAIETMFPDVEFHWAGESNPGSPDLEDYANIRDWDRNQTGTPKPTAQELETFWVNWIAAHPTIAQEIIDAIRSAAKESAKNIPGWARWTVEEAELWYAANVSDLLPVANLAAANEVLANMAQAQWAIIQMLLAIRNQTWPQLEAGGE